MPFIVEKSNIPDILTIEPKVFTDERGFFIEVFKKKDFESFGMQDLFVQVNHSSSTRGVLRGLHYQLIPAEQGKLIRCIKGEIFDVAVDIRKNSPWFSKYVGQTLSENNRKMMYVPAGFAHGFCVLSDIAEIEYYCTKEYAPEYERGVIWNDPELNIAWPLKDPLLSPKDKKFKPFKEIESNFIFK